MASALSEDEFHRLQLQLLELRTGNYELDGKSKKLERELTLSQERCEHLDKELAKANKAINKSKKTKEVELLIQENDGLQSKLHSQEEEFRLQNQTLMQELSTLVASNEQFEKELSEIKGDQDNGKGGNSELEDEVRRLQAENSVLTKNLNAIKDKYEKEVRNERDGPPMIEREPPPGLEERKVEGSDKVEDTITENDGNVDKLTEEINRLNISLETEKEEKKIMKDELTTLEKKLKEDVASLQNENEKLNEKFKRKQESYMAIQKEKEEMFAESSKKVEDIQAGRDRDQKYYQDIQNKLQKEIDKLKSAEENNAAGQKIQELEQTIVALQSQLDAANIVGNQQLTEQTTKLRTEIVDLRNKLTKSTQLIDDLKVQLTESQKAANETIEQLHASQHERDTQIQSVQEITKVAEKRKSILDELAIKYQKEIDNHRDSINKQEEKHNEVVTSLTQQITKLQDELVELEKVKILYEELQTTHKSINDSKCWLERRLKETEENLEQCNNDQEEAIKEMKSSHESELRELVDQYEIKTQKLLEDHESSKKEWKEKEKKLENEIEILTSTITSLRQELKDSVGNKKIHEKKGQTMIKDLKRQLQSERKRAEKLQERLQEILTDSKDKQSMEELFRSSDSNDMFRCDNSSVSSWSASGGNRESNNSGPQSPTNTNKSFSEDVEQEYGELLTKMGGMQQTSWELEEKVAHLEMSNACMAEDLLRKTAIIEHYVMESRPDHRSNNQHGHHHDEKLSLKKVLDLVNKGEDSELKEMNKKLQNMVEETLTKNMHLQKDLEMMSNEVVRLSKLTSKHQNSDDGACTNNQVEVKS